MVKKIIRERTRLTFFTRSASLQEICEFLTDVSDLTTRLQMQSSLCFSDYAFSRQKALELHFAYDVPLFWLSPALGSLQNLSLEPVLYMGNTWHLSASDTMNFK